MRKLLLLLLPALFLASCHTHDVQTPFWAKFKNMLYTDIQISVSGYGSKVISPGETVSFRIDRADQCYTYNAETYGSNANGDLIGLVVGWERTRDISGNSYTTYLITNADLFFLKMRNTGIHNLRPLYVNWGLINETVDNIIIPGNGITYSTGYYQAYENTRIQANWMDLPSDYTYWQHRTHFNFPWTENQSVTLLNNFKQGASGKGAYELQAEVETHALDPRGDEPFGIDAGVPRN